MTTEQLIEACKKNDRKAQFKLFETYFQLVVNTCSRYCSDSHTAKDLAQQSFIKAFHAIHKFDNNKGKFESWIRRIAINESLQYLRKTKKLVVLTTTLDDNLEIEDTSPFKIEADVNIDHLIQIIEELPPGYSTVFKLYVIEELSHKEIASMLDISESSSRSQLSKAKSMIRKRSPLAYIKSISK